MAGKQASDSRDWLKCFASREARTPATSAGEDPFLLLPVNLQYSKNHIKKPSYREIPCADWVPVTLLYLIIIPFKVYLKPPYMSLIRKQRQKRIKRLLTTFKWHRELMYDTRLEVLLGKPTLTFGYILLSVTFLRNPCPCS